MGWFITEATRMLVAHLVNILSISKMEKRRQKKHKEGLRWLGPVHHATSTVPGGLTMYGPRSDLATVVVDSVYGHGSLWLAFCLLCA
ncbi:hypothetical protein ABZP36_028526 [Zizania latifolia]